MPLKLRERRVDELLLPVDVKRRRNVKGVQPRQPQSVKLAVQRLLKN